MSDLDNEELKATREMKVINKIIAPEEKTADEMFEELGYKKQTNNYMNYFEYIKKENEFIQLCISFEGTSKTIMSSMYINGNSISKGLAITMQELQAINKKCKELGWLE